MITAWRIVQAAYTASAMDGEGASMFGGRWNSPGTRVVYLAQSKSLAALEILVHADRSLLGLPYAMIPVRFDDGLCVEFTPLPFGYGYDPAPSRAAGDAWVASKSSLLICVPSVVMPGEWNYVLNPAHPDIGKLAVGSAETYRFDNRLR